MSGAGGVQTLCGIEGGELREGFRRIGEQAFYGCRSLKELSLPSGLAVIGEMAFYRCKALREARIPKSVEYVGNLAFGQSGVRRAYAQGDGRGYGTGVFSGCTRLEVLEIGPDVRHIADRLAYGCTSLKQVILPGTIASVGRNPWEHTPFLEAWLQKGIELEEEILWDGRNLSGEVRLSEKVRILAGGAFYGNMGLTAIRLPKSIEWIGAAAFKGCGGLRLVDWETGLDSLEAEVFSGCSQLESIERSESEEPFGDEAGAGVVWRVVGERAFYRCERLCEVRLGHVRSIGREAFAGCRRLEGGVLNEVRESDELWIGERAFEDTVFMEGEKGALVMAGGIVLSAHDCAGEVFLPEGVTGIAPYAFAGNKRITKVVLPESLCRIGEGAFWGCSGLAHVAFPHRFLQVDDRAFEKCASLQEVDICAKRLGNSAFAFCGSLTRAALLGVRFLGERLFAGCGNLETCVCGNAEEIHSFCFSGCNRLRDFDLSRISFVGEHAFAGCDNLRQISFHRDVRLEPYAFADCGRLEEIRVGEEANLRLKEYAFSGCTALRRVCLGESKWRLEAYGDLFSRELPRMARVIFHSVLSCFAVEREENLCGYQGTGRIVKIPRGIRRIEAEVFRDVLMLEELEIPEDVEYIGARAFHGTAWMERQRQKSPMVTVRGMLLDASGCSGEVVVPEEIRLVCGWAFANGMDIERIRFLSDQVKVEEYAFRNCIYLREIVLPDGFSYRIEGIADRQRELPALVKQAVLDSMNCFKTDERGVLVECTGNISRLRIAEGITAIGEGVFQDGNLLTQVTFPLTLRVVGKRAFSGCKWLKEVCQAQNVEEIEDMVFWGCGALERVELSDKLRRLGARAFENCTSLTEICIPEGVEEIPDRAFYRCHSLKRLRLPSGLRRIGKEAFAFCRELKEISLPEGVLLEERAFVGCESLKGRDFAGANS